LIERVVAEYAAAELRPLGRLEGDTGAAIMDHLIILYEIGGASSL
jgi:hypothetical protein